MKLMQIKPGKSNWATFLILFMLVMLLASSFCVDYTYADTTGVVYNTDGEGLNVRSSASTSSSKIGWLAEGASVTILSGPSGGWYNIKYGTGTGYVSADYIKVSGSGNNDSSTPSYTYSASFEEAIKSFPESYKAKLRILHELHPSWVFVACNTNLEWNTVISKECKPGVNTIINSMPAAYISNESWALVNGRPKIFDAGGYVAASKAAIEYYMDPRNFLNESSLFQFLSNEYNSGITDAQYLTGINNIVSGSFMDKSKGFPESGYPTYASLFLTAGKEYRGCREKGRYPLRTSGQRNHACRLIITKD